MRTNGVNRGRAITNADQPYWSSTSSTIDTSSASSRLKARWATQALLLHSPSVTSCPLLAGVLSASWTKLQQGPRDWMGNLLVARVVGWSGHGSTVQVPRLVNSCCGQVNFNGAEWLIEWCLPNDLERWPMLDAYWWWSNRFNGSQSGLTILIALLRGKVTNGRYSIVAKLWLIVVRRRLLIIEMVNAD